MAIQVYGFLAVVALVAVVAPLYVAIRVRDLPLGVRLFLIALPASIPATIPLVNVAFGIGDWVGGGHPIPFAVIIVFIPATACGLGGLVTVGYGSRRRMPSVVGCGILGIAAAFLEYLLLGAIIALGHIS